MVVEELKNFNSSIIKKEKQKKRKENELSFIKKKKKKSLISKFFHFLGNQRQHNQCNAHSCVIGLKFSTENVLVCS